MMTMQFPFYWISNENVIPNCLSTDESNGFKAVFVGFYVYASNTTNKDDGQLCFHDNEYFNLSTIPAVLTLNCSLCGRYVIYYNERIDGQPIKVFRFQRRTLLLFFGFFFFIILFFFSYSISLKRLNGFS